ncbi:DUF7837 family putative zinc-binding protein [Halogranum amylolyticum]
MSSKQSSLGSCPDCKCSLPSSSLLIEYEKADGSIGKFADCSHCDKVVRPQ